MKRILITGGARRVGAAIARKCAEAGAHVVIHCHRSVADARQLVAALPGAGHDVICADLADPALADSLFARLDKPVDVLINNASAYGRFPGVLQEKPEEMRRYFQINCFAPVSLMRQFAEQAGAGEGVIVNLLDQEVFCNSPDGGGYAWSRRALRDATLEYARSLAPRIRVCGVAPGPVLPPEWCPESRMEKTLARVPLGRPVALDDLTAAVMFLIQNRSVTGEILSVDCGQHLYKG